MPESPVETAHVQQLFPGYELLATQERGARGAVYVASHIATERTVAIRVLAHGALKNERARQRFLRELSAIARLSHENILTLYDFGEVDGWPYAITQHVPGMPIADHVFLHEYSARRCVELLLKVCDGLAHAHGMGVIHRDIRPANILVTAEHKPYLADFGLSMGLADQEPRLAADQVPYLAPEQAAGGRADARSDQYALAVVLYELITDRLPYALTGSREQALHAIAREEPAALCRNLKRLGRCKPAEIDRDLQAVMSKVLHKRPDQRYDSPAAFGQDLRRWLAGDAVLARLGNTPYLLRKAARKHAWPLITVAAAALTGSAALWMRAPRFDKAPDPAMSSYLERATTARELDRVDEAQNLLQAVVAMGDNLDDSFDFENQHGIQFSAVCRSGELALAQHDLALAEKQCAMAVQMARELRDQRDDPAAQRAWGAALRLRARVRMAHEDWDAAAALLDEAVAIRKQLLDQEQHNESLERELASVLALRGTCLRKLKRYDAALDDLEAEYRIRLNLHASNHTVDSAVSLAYSRLHLANWHMVQKNASSDRVAREHLAAGLELIENEAVQRIRPRDTRRLNDALTRNIQILDERGGS